MSDQPSLLTLLIVEKNTHPSKNTTKSTCQTSSREEHGNSELSLCPAIPHTQVEHDTRKQRALGNTKKEADREKAGEIVHDALECCDDAEDERAGWQEDFG